MISLGRERDQLEPRRRARPGAEAQRRLHAAFFENRRKARRTDENGIFGRGKLGKRGRGPRRAGERTSRSPGSSTWARSPRASVDAVLDASAAGAVAEHLAWALETGTNLVIAATGWDARSSTPRGSAAAGIGVLGFAQLLALGGLHAEGRARPRPLRRPRRGQLPRASSERHHAAKADAPSGTAKLLAERPRPGLPALHRAGTGQRPSAARSTSRASAPAPRSATTRSGYETGADSHRALAQGGFARHVREGRPRRPPLDEGPQGLLHLRRRGRGHHRSALRRAREEETWT